MIDYHELGKRRKLHAIVVAGAHGAGITSGGSGDPLANAQQRRSFFPNIVMIDFADDPKCQTIRDLNDISMHHLSGVR